MTITVCYSGFCYILPFINLTHLSSSLSHRLQHKRGHTVLRAPPWYQEALYAEAPADGLTDHCRVALSDLPPDEQPHENSLTLPACFVDLHNRGL